MGNILNNLSKIIIIYLSLFTSTAVFAKDFGIVGKTFPIAEKNPVEVIKLKLSKMEKSGELKKLQNQWQKNSIQRAKRPKDAIKKISKATSNQVRYFDPSITVQSDLKDHQGKVFAKKGTRVNPFDHFPNYHPQLIFIDGDDEGQVKFALDKVKNSDFASKIVLVRGNIVDLIKQYHQQIFFDQNGFLCEKFGIEVFPSVVEREDKMLRIEEVAL